MIDYPIEEALERIAETVEGFKLDKPVDEMSEEEIFAAEYASTKYVEWVDDDDYAQLVPKVKKTGQILYPAICRWYTSCGYAGNDIVFPLCPELFTRLPDKCCLLIRP